MEEGILLTDSSINPLHTFLRGIVDYAGLFPPAGLDMATAVRNYAEYRNGPNAWMLGSFIVPVSRLDEFSISAEDVIQSKAHSPWKLSVLVSQDFEKEMSIVRDFNKRNGPASAAVGAIETKASSVEEIKHLAQQKPADMELYTELSVGPDPQPLISAIAATGLRAKVRTGGTSTEMFPSSAELARFIHECVATGVPFKATAGLHHPVRSTYRLTYAADSSSGTMFGFLNVFLAAAFERKGMGMKDLTEVLEEQSADAFRFENGGVRWREHQLTNTDLETTRRTVATTFGSCSFREPVDDLMALGLL